MKNVVTVVHNEMPYDFCPSRTIVTLPPLMMQLWIHWICGVTPVSPHSTDRITRLQEMEDKKSNTMLSQGLFILRMHL